MPQAKGVWCLGSCGISNLHRTRKATSPEGFEGSDKWKTREPNEDIERGSDEAEKRESAEMEIEWANQEINFRAQIEPAKEDV
ncbi:hypothetical protein AVEN_5696-1 [Araneus ventricosus]|uniref:Uncharacterized protein n=1 Tax=Araneus ventricosus TaxID=182803 RepID=A0A4Y2DWJ4_ARAVE|nr:hypothetical protein AVEN_5696-1 [Araneus ventricosus]